MKKIKQFLLNIVLGIVFGLLVTYGIFYLLLLMIPKTSWYP